MRKPWRILVFVSSVLCLASLGLWVFAPAQPRMLCFAALGHYVEIGMQRDLLHVTMVGNYRHWEMPHTARPPGREMFPLTTQYRVPPAPYVSSGRVIWWNSRGAGWPPGETTARTRSATEMWLLCWQAALFLGALPAGWLIITLLRRLRRDQLSRVRGFEPIPVTPASR